MDKEKLNQGIARDRGVTDCLCGVLFLGFAATMLVLLFWTISQGQTELLFAPVSFVNQTATGGTWEIMDRVDSVRSDNIHYCGVSAGYEDYKWLYFANLNKRPDQIDEIMDTGICVKECPQ